MTFDGASSTYEEYSPDEVAALIENHDVLMAYDAYIRTAFDARLPDTGWCPVCVAEFRETEYRNVWLGRLRGGRPWAKCMTRQGRLCGPGAARALARRALRPNQGKIGTPRRTAATPENRMGAISTWES